MGTTHLRHPAAVPLLATFFFGWWSEVGVGTNSRTSVLCVPDHLRLGSCVLRCSGGRLCGRGFMLMKLICSVSSNQSHGEYPDCRSDRQSIGDASLLVSPLVVAGIVIGLVLFLSCVTIIVGSLRKDSRLRNPHLRASYAADGFSYGGSLGDLRSTCLEEFPPALDFDSFTETLSQSNAMYQDSPPRYDEVMGPGATQIYIPTEDPPPYSLLDPCQRGSEQEEEPSYTSTDSSTNHGATSAAWFSPARYPMGSQEAGGRQPITSVSFPLEAAPPYESVVGDGENGGPLPLMPCDLYKHQSEGRADSGSPPRQPETNHIL